mmetsp:Transcript_40750/g.65458  ORF Transcript_40750/g.65458 Transcript_40750/m.65458 type:complete len:288 (+) Transcript_40750:2396-3259(+)
MSVRIAAAVGVVMADRTRRTMRFAVHVIAPRLVIGLIVGFLTERPENGIALSLHELMLVVHLSLDEFASLVEPIHDLQQLVLSDLLRDVVVLVDGVIDLHDWEVAHLKVEALWSKRKVVGGDWGVAVVPVKDMALVEHNGVLVGAILFGVELEELVSEIAERFVVLLVGGQSETEILEELEDQQRVSKRVEVAEIGVVDALLFAPVFDEHNQLFHRNGKLLLENMDDGQDELVAIPAVAVSDGDIHLDVERVVPVPDSQDWILCVEDAFHVELVALIVLFDDRGEAV